MLAVIDNDYGMDVKHKINYYYAGGKSERQLLRLKTVFNLLKNFVIILLSKLILIVCACSKECINIHKMTEVGIIFDVCGIFAIRVQ